MSCVFDYPPNYLVWNSILEHHRDNWSRKIQ